MKRNLTVAAAIASAVLCFTACKKSQLTTIADDNTTANLVTNDATIYVPGLDDAHNILLNATGYNPKFMTVNEPWEKLSPQNYQLGLVASKANMIRYPGGTWGSYFDYNNEKMFPKMASGAADGWVNTSKINNDAIADNISNDLQKTNSVADLQVAAGGNGSGQTVNVVFQMNMITPGWDYYHSAHPSWSAPNPGSTNLNDTWYKMLDDRYARFKAMLLKAHNTGSYHVPLQFIELGNEYYFGDDYQVEAFPDGGVFGKAANYIANKLKNDPDLSLPANVRIAATASCVSGSTRATNWDSTLKGTLDRNLVPYVTMHVYQAFTPPSTYNETNFQNKVVQWMSDVNDKYTASNAQTTFIAPSNGNPWRVWYTETNANWDGDTDDSTPQDDRTWAQSLIEAYSAQFLYDRGNADMYLQFQFNNQVRDNADTAANGRLYDRALALMPFMQASDNATATARVSFVGTGLPTLPGNPKGVVAGYCFTTSAAVKQCFFINLSGSSKHLNLGANIFTTGATSLHVKSYNNTSIGSTANPVLTNATYTKTDVTLLPYSVNYIYQ